MSNIFVEQIEAVKKVIEIEMAEVASVMARRGFQRIARHELLRKGASAFHVRLQGRYDGLEICKGLLEMDYPVELQDRYPEILPPREA